MVTDFSMRPCLNLSCLASSVIGELQLYMPLLQQPESYVITPISNPLTGSVCMSAGESDHK